MILIPDNRNKTHRRHWYLQDLFKTSKVP
jgi:hypothetical protein